MLGGCRKLHNEEFHNWFPGDSGFPFRISRLLIFVLWIVNRIPTPSRPGGLVLSVFILGWQAPHFKVLGTRFPPLHDLTAHTVQGPWRGHGMPKTW
jgi:hypothetical protein